jgi:general secretion pathway protein E
VYYGEGCTDCRGTGYRGRTGVFEILDMTESLRAIIASTSDIIAIEKAARSEGMSTLRESAVRKLLRGITTYEEIVSMT